MVTLMNWYLAQLLFAEPTEDLQASVLCESSYVLFRAETATLAYDKAMEWGHRHEDESAFAFLGVRHMNSLDEPPGDGVELGGGFFEEVAVWLRRDEWIPPREEIPVIVLEQNPDTPIGELADDDTKARLRRLFGRDDDAGELPE